MFNYTDLHLFDKNGYELPLSMDSCIKITVPNIYGIDAEFLGITNDNKDIIGLHKLSGGGRFDMGQEKKAVITYGADTMDSVITVRTKPYKSSDENNNEYTIDDIDISSLPPTAGHDITFPSLTMTSKLVFDKVSTELVETQSLYLMVKVKDNDTYKYITLEEYKAIDPDCAAFLQKYHIIFYIDGRNQQDFRFFTVNNDEAVWSDRHVINTSVSSESNYKINIGFTGNEEGVYEEKLYMVLADDAKEEVYPLLTVDMYAETEGEDERYRTLFADFGIPDVKNFNNVFKDTDLKEGKTDNISLNRHSKELMLSYDQIFPYVGTYKALLNAISVLGYNDIFFKEWYKKTGVSDVNHKGHIAYDIKAKNSGCTGISSLPIDIKIKLKKLNWLSMFYHLNEENTDMPFDKYGFPSTVKTNNYYTDDNLIKLISLREWLEKYILGLNCRIIDIGGEGIYFERYKIEAYSTYQQNLEFNSETNIAAYTYKNDNTIIDSSAYITLNIENEHTTDTIESLKDIRFSDLCTGHLDSDNIYHIKNETVEYPINISRTISGYDNEIRYKTACSVNPDSFMFDYNFLISTSPRLLVKDDNIIFNAFDIVKKNSTNSVFKKLPVISLKKCNIYKISDKDIKNIKYKIYFDNTSYVIEDAETGKMFRTNTYITLVPPESFDSIDFTHTVIKPVAGPVFTRPKYVPVLDRNQYGAKIDMTSYGLRFMSASSSQTPMFYITGYQLKDVTAMMLDTYNEYSVDILDGNMTFTDDDNERIVYLVFDYDKEKNKIVTKTYIRYLTENFELCNYNDINKFNHFIPGKKYNVFAHNYNTNPEISISYDPIRQFEIYNKGSYSIDITGQNTYGEIYASKVKGENIINIPDPDLMIYTNTPANKKGEAGYLIDADYISDMYINYNIHPYQPLLGDIYTNENNIEYSIYPYHAVSSNDNDYITCYNTGDMFTISSVTETETLENVYFYMTMKLNYTEPDTRIVNDSDTDALLDFPGITGIKNILNAAVSIEDSILDCQFSLYNTIGEFYSIQLPGVMINAKLTGDSTDKREYHILAVCSKSSYNVNKVKTILHGALEDSKIYACVIPLWKEKVELVEYYDNINAAFAIKLVDNKLFKPFKTGEMVRITFTSANDSSIYSAASYKVIGYDPVDYNKIYLKGEINDNYIGETTVSYIYDLIPVEENSFSIIDGLLAKNGNTTFSFIWGPNPGDHIEYQMPAEYVNIDGSTRIQYQVFAFDSDRYIIFPPYYNKIATGDILAYVSYAHNAFVNYNMQIKSAEVNPRKAVVSMPNSVYNKKLLQYVDDTFKLKTRKYNINNGHENWMGHNDDNIPEICDKKIYLHYGSVELLQDNKCIVLEADFFKKEFMDYNVYAEIKWSDAVANNYGVSPDGYLTHNDTSTLIYTPKDGSGPISYSTEASRYYHQDGMPYLKFKVKYYDPDIHDLFYPYYYRAPLLSTKYNIYWDVYRQTSETEHELVLESWNKTLYMKPIKPGTYDVKVNIFDEFGNMSSKDFIGVFTVPYSETETRDANAYQIYCKNIYDSSSVIPVDTKIYVNDKLYDSSTTYLYGDIVTIKTENNSEYNFDGWYINDYKILNELEYTICITGDLYIDAHFKRKRQCDVSVMLETIGTDSSLNQVYILIDGEKYSNMTFDIGDYCHIKLEKEDIYDLDGWFLNGEELSDITGTEFTTEITEESMSFKAKISERAKYELIVNTGGNGTVTGSGEYYMNSYVPITAIPDANYYFKGWYHNGTLISTSQIENIQVTENPMVITGVFMPVPQAFNVNISCNIPECERYINPNVGISTYIIGDEADIFISNSILDPLCMYIFEGWKDVNGNLLTSNLKITGIVSDTVLKAEFSPKAYNIKFIYDRSEGLCEAIPPKESYGQGEAVTLKANPNTFYTFEKWVINNITYDTNIIDITVDSNIEVFAYFKYAEPFYIKNIGDNVSNISYNMDSGNTRFEINESYDESTGSFNDYKWADWNKQSYINLYPGKRVYIRSKSSYSALNCNIYTNGSDLTLGGCLTSLLVKNAEWDYDISGYTRCFADAFKDNQNIIDVSDLVLPTTTASGCYYNMFKNCVNLARIPVLDKIESYKRESCHSMFENTDILSADIHISNPESLCCYRMFANCLNLNNVTLSMSEHANQSYMEMFLNDINLVSFTAKFRKWGNENINSTLDWLKINMSSTQTTNNYYFYKNPILLNIPGNSYIPERFIVQDI